MPMLTRRSMLVTAAGGGLAMAGGAVRLSRAAETASSADASIVDALPHFPLQDPDRVREIVGKSHADLDFVKREVEKRPELARATIDWGFGDWETALGAASHVGRRDIAEVLIAHGARPDIFAMAMLGMLDAVRAVLTASPEFARIKGPHGIPLLAHARAGGDQAKPVLDYLRTVPGAGEPLASNPLDEQSAARVVGTYAFGPGPRDRLAVRFEKEQLQMQREGSSPRRLLRVEGDTYFPTGAPTVRVRFVVQGDAATKLSVHDPDEVVVATRVSG